MARTLQNQGRTEDAKKMYLEAVKLAPQRADAYHFLALLHDRKGECREAEPFYQQALQIDDQNAAVHCDLGYSYYLQQRWAEAETQLRRALELDSDLKRGHNNLGLLLARTGREREAWEEFRLAGIGPAEAHTNLAYVYTMLDRWTDAEAEYQQALAIDPRLKPAQEGLAKLRSLAAKRGTGPAEMARR
jgi:Tfp pilus assembly protein PilF